jgi:metal-sulfur cluster biosynthetic enzyme
MTKELIIEELKKVIDPELDINIVDLGLVRDVEFGEFDQDFKVYDYIKVIMTLTTPMCPFVDILIQNVEDCINLLGQGEAQVELTFDPPWEMPESLKLEMGL